MKCAPGNCFDCIREGTSYEFAWECKVDVLRKMDEDERWGLAQEVFDTALREFELHGPKLSQRNAEVLGDCLACLYMFGLGNRMVGKGTRPRYITSQQIRQVLPILKRSRKKSMQANGVLSVVLRKNYPFVKCWLRMNREYNGPRNRT